MKMVGVDMFFFSFMIRFENCILVAQLSIDGSTSSNITSLSDVHIYFHLLWCKIKPSFIIYIILKDISLPINYLEIDIQAIYVFICSSTSTNYHP